MEDNKKVKIKAKCEKCSYEWETGSKAYLVSCPMCLNKVKIREVDNEEK